ncbi:MAG TPA: glycosyltransferase family 1 protein [Polyangiaceae bacterium]|jgi:glycosyltransferase involved in cell wall biosynthesis|nr:MAG: GDP-mannose-dependent alpha-(1-6)-phosphatidylinositol monomannoside mannosyltransferase [Deltaproteobacteria bacterium ADurb.Bin207]HNS95930.1 glycosyltransferase family 1 protein [Polyangiaceae bacterium]HNZ22549.1 glycosyltransferase family 1 protein [Polyangiaceae bacterium]HOD23630.1 glycosyltransferase family 1 protein [Polyangiaceae bacterium]HOE50104.1 glycosyltransferase family 1 protein [Polyangiaceae bacterium]
MSTSVVIDFSPLDTPTQRRGIGRYLRSLALGLSRLDPNASKDIRPIGLLGLSGIGVPIISEDFHCIATHAWKRAPTQFDRYRWAYTRRLALWKAMQKLNARLVHLGDPNATPLAMSFAQCKRVATCHDLIPLQFPKQYLGVRDGFGVIGKRLIKRRFHSADHVVAISNATRQQLIKLLDIPHDRISLVYNGVDLSTFSPHDPGDDQRRLARFALTPRKYLLYAGDLDWRKNTEGMIKSLAFAHRLGSDLILAFVGDLDASKIEELKRLASYHGVDNRIRRLGFVSDTDLRALYRQALAHLLLSRFEGFGYTVIEAMASGCPVITTRGGSLEEIAGNAAIVQSPDDTEAIGQAIHSLHVDPARRESLISAGLDWAPRFSCEIHASHMLDVFRSVLA